MDAAPVPPPPYAGAVPSPPGPVYAWGQAPYSGPGYPWQPQEPMPGWNGKAIASFVLGLLAVFPLGLILGIVALVGIGRTRQRGKGLAITGVVLSGVWAVVGCLALVGALVFAIAPRPDVSPPSGLGSSPDPGAYALGATASPGDLPPWTCFNPPRTPGNVFTVTVASCDGQHDQQLFAVIPVTGPYPGPDADKFQANLACNQAAYKDMVDPVGLPALDAEVYTYYPAADSWSGPGGPQIWCAVTGTEGYNSLYQDANLPKSQYTAQQLAYLDLARPASLFRNDLQDVLPVDWAQGRSVAAQLAAADLTEAQQLTAPVARSVFTTPSLQQAAAQQAQSDRGEAAALRELSQVSTQAGWTTELNDMEIMSTQVVTYRMILRDDLKLPTA